jgi:hypothetical protein
MESEEKEVKSNIYYKPMEVQPFDEELNTKQTIESVHRKKMESEEKEVKSNIYYKPMEEQPFDEELNTKHTLKQHIDEQKSKNVKKWQLFDQPFSAHIKKMKNQPFEILFKTDQQLKQVIGDDSFDGDGFQCDEVWFSCDGADVVVKANKRVGMN